LVTHPIVYNAESFGSSSPQYFQTVWQSLQSIHSMITIWIMIIFIST